MTLPSTRVCAAAAVRPAGISVVVPCLNERHNVCALLRVLATASERCDSPVEVIVVDGGSHDGTADAARSMRVPVRVVVHACAPGRARQMNSGAASARYATLYFVHADTRPPLDCLRAVAASRRSGARIGGFAFAFDSPRALLRFNAYWTTFNVIATRGGDQSIFVEYALYRALEGFDEDWVIMEEYDLLARAARAGAAYELLEGRTLVSDRKYQGRAWARVQVANIIAMASWRLGASPRAIRARYVAALGPGKEALR